MTVGELLQLTSLNGLKLFSRSLGVHREISTVTVVDTPDGFQWLKGNESSSPQHLHWNTRQMLF